MAALGVQEFFNQSRVFFFNCPLQNSGSPFSKPASSGSEKVQSQDSVQATVGLHQCGEVITGEPGSNSGEDFGGNSNE